MNSHQIDVTNPSQRLYDPSHTKEDLPLEPTIVHCIISHLSEANDYVNAHLVCRCWNQILSDEETWKYFSQIKFSSVTQKHIEENHDGWKAFYFHFLKSGYYFYPNFYGCIHFGNENRNCEEDEIPMTVNFITADNFRYKFKQNELVNDIITKIGNHIGIYNAEEYGLHKASNSCWLSRKKCLLAQEVIPGSTICFRRQLYLPGNSKCGAVFLDYMEAVEKVLSGLIVVNQGTAVNLAALQLRVSFGEYRKYMQKKAVVRMEELFLPKQYHEKKIISEVWEQYQLAKFGSRLEAKQAYLTRVKSLPTYGRLVFPVEYESKKQNLCISYAPPFISLENGSSTQVLAAHFKELKEWKASMSQFILELSSSSQSSVKSFYLKTSRAAEFGEIVSRLVQISKLFRSGKSTREISVPVMFGFQKGHVVLFDVSISTPAQQFQNRLENHFGTSEIPGNQWGLLCRSDGVWFDKSAIIGNYNLYSVAVGGLELKPKIAPLCIKLADKSVQMVEVDFSIKVSEVLKWLSLQWEISIEGLGLKFGNSWLIGSICLSAQGLKEYDVVQFRYDYIPQIHQGDTELSIYLKYIQAQELVDLNEGIEHLREKDVVNMAAARMIAENRDDYQYAFENYIPKGFKDENLLKRITKRREQFISKGMSKTQAETRYFRSFGYHTAQFQVTHNGTEKTLFINQREVILVTPETKPVDSQNFVFGTLNQIETTLIPSLILNVIGLNSPPLSPSRLLQEKQPSVMKWNMHLLQKFTLTEDGQGVNILINMEEVVVTCKKPKSIMKSLQTFNIYIKEDIKNMVQQKPSPPKEHLEFVHQTITEESATLITYTLEKDSPTLLDLSWSTITPLLAQKIASSITTSTSLSIVKLRGLGPSIIRIFLKALHHHQSVSTLDLTACVFDSPTVEALLCLLDAPPPTLSQLLLWFVPLEHDAVVTLEVALGKLRQHSLGIQIHPEEDEMVSRFGQYYVGMKENHDQNYQ